MSETRTEMPGGKGFIFRYRPNNNYTIDELKNNYIYFSKRQQLNDPYDCYPGMLQISEDKYSLQKHLNRALRTKPRDQRQGLKRHYESNNGEYKKLLDNEMSNILNNIGIACFSDLPVNLMMWSQYGNFHKGICLQYELKDDPKFFSPIFEMSYKEELPKFIYNPDFNNDEIFFRVLSTKSRVWEGEREIRVFKSSFGKLNFKPACLRSIVFGINCDWEYMKEVIKATRHYPDLKIYRSRPHPTEFGLELQEAQIDILS